MKILNLCFQDMAGVAYSLSHAINKLTEHQAINLRSTTSTAKFPAFAEMGFFGARACRKLVYRADVVIFHSTLRPYYGGLMLDPEKMRDKQQILYFHGTDARALGDQIVAQAHEISDTFKVVCSTPDLLLYLPEETQWLPAARSFTEITRKYGMCRQDRQALKAFEVKRERVCFCHAPSSVQKKGSTMFYRAVSSVIKELPQVFFLGIYRQPWDGCLRLLSKSDVLLDQDPPFIGSYGMLAVEASIFKIPVVTRMFTDVVKIIKQDTGFDSPFIGFTDEAELKTKLMLLATEPEIRTKFGRLAYRYCKAVHDEKPVVERFLKVIGD